MTLPLPMQVYSHTADSSRKSIGNIHFDEKNLHLVVVMNNRAAAASFSYEQAWEPLTGSLVMSEGRKGEGLTNYSLVLTVKQV